MRENVVSYNYLKIFILLALLLFVIAIIVRFTSEVVQSKFGNNSFSVLYVSQNSKVIVVDRNEKSASYLSIGDIRNIVKGKSTFEASIALGIPINAIVIDQGTAPANIKEFVSFESAIKLLTGNGITYKNCNRYDMHKLINAVRGSVEDNRVEQEVEILGGDISKIDELFNDSIIHNMPYTVEIDNGTSINGLGNLFALILSKQGYNVIAVRTVPPSEDSFVAFNEDQNLFTKSLVGLTGFSYKQEKVSKAADVTINLGSDLDILLDN